MSDYPVKGGVCQGVTTLWSIASLNQSPQKPISLFSKQLEEIIKPTSDKTLYKHALLNNIFIFQNTDVDISFWGRVTASGLRPLRSFLNEEQVDLIGQTTYMVDTEQLFIYLQEMAEQALVSFVIHISTKDHVIAFYYDHAQQCWSFFDINQDVSNPTRSLVSFKENYLKAFMSDSVTNQDIYNISLLVNHKNTGNDLILQAWQAFKQKNSFKIEEGSGENFFYLDKVMHTALLFADHQTILNYCETYFDRCGIKIPFCAQAALLGNLIVISEILKRAPSSLQLAQIIFYAISANQLEVVEMLLEHMTEKKAYHVLFISYQAISACLSVAMNLSLQPVVFKGLSLLTNLFDELQPYMTWLVFLLSFGYGVKLSIDRLNGLLDPFCQALLSSDIAKIDQLLTGGYDVNHIFSTIPCPPIYIAARLGNEAIFDKVLSQQDLIVDKPIQGLKMTALQVAARKGHLKIVQKLIQHGAKINLCNVWGRSALHLAVTAGQTAVVKFLLLNGANPNFKDIYGISVLSLLAQSENQELKQLADDISSCKASFWTQEITSQADAICSLKPTI